MDFADAMVHTKNVESTMKVQLVKTKYGINQCPQLFLFDIEIFHNTYISQIQYGEVKLTPST